MSSSFLPKLNNDSFQNALAKEDELALFDLLVQPLHEALYEKNDFSFMNSLSEGQQLFLSYDYLRMQVEQGGFIQFLVNGYAPLLMNMPEWFSKIGATEMALLIDDVLKVYVLNIDFFQPDINVEAFGKLYEELKEFEELDRRFDTIKATALKQMVEMAKGTLSEFCTLV